MTASQATLLAGPQLKLKAVLGTWQAVLKRVPSSARGHRRGLVADSLILWKD
ncbi:MAG TPA: hypothetical protein PKG54_10615 [Phycisphaerae bacterium]|jgi:hypothetical protein|nr:hypothetical protein [Phycisphaerae bacterium]HOL25756.1 hypothetical protein [Phycisphaerae bacterium]HPP19551.1 hypothetical protein [Phycisphaerae bacterium]HQE42519.1 hypothetical protein [Phycisphaerae bacterium]